MNLMDQNPNPKAYNALIMLSMAFMTIMLLSGVLTYRLVLIDNKFITQGGALVTPIWFILMDIIAEVYGYRKCIVVVWTGFGCQLFFGVIIFLVNSMPFPAYWHGLSAYHLVLDGTLRTVISAILAFVIGGYINTYLLTRWKFLLKGKFFVLRSLGASTLSELFFTAMAVTIIQFGYLSSKQIVHIILVSYALKVIYTLVLTGPAGFVCGLIKRIEKIDIYDNCTRNPLGVFKSAT
jgi:uncharacterized integral membrane protein (TIGR00697 family)